MDCRCDSSADSLRHSNMFGNFARLTLSLNFYMLFCLDGLMESVEQLRKLLISSMRIIVLFALCRYAHSCAFIPVIELPRIPAYCPKVPVFCRPERLRSAGHRFHKSVSGKKPDDLHSKAERRSYRLPRGSAYKSHLYEPTPAFLRDNP